MDSSKPLETGTTFVGPLVDARGIMRKYRMEFGNAESLGVLKEEFVFFTPAVMYLYGRFTDALLIDYVFEQRQDIRFYFRKFDKPVFKGLHTPAGNQDWNHALWAMRADYWESFVDFICSVTFTDMANKQVIQFGMQTLEIVDPLILEKKTLYQGGELPLLPIGAFGVMLERGQLAFMTGESALTDLPTLLLHPPSQDFLMFSKALFAGQNPILAREAFRLKNSKEAENASET